LAKKDVDESRYFLAVQYSFGLGVEKDEGLALDHLREGEQFFVKPSSVREDKWPEFFAAVGTLFGMLGDRESLRRYFEIGKDHYIKVSASFLSSLLVCFIVFAPLCFFLFCFVFWIFFFRGFIFSDVLDDRSTWSL
jgi:hypothetical protein